MKSDRKKPGCILNVLLEGLQCCAAGCVRSLTVSASSFQIKGHSPGSVLNLTSSPVIPVLSMCCSVSPLIVIE